MTTDPVHTLMMGQISKEFLRHGLCTGTRAKEAAVMHETEGT